MNESVPWASLIVSYNLDIREDTFWAEFDSYALPDGWNVYEVTGDLLGINVSFFICGEFRVEDAEKVKKMLEDLPEPCGNCGLMICQDPYECSYQLDR